MMRRACASSVGPPNIMVPRQISDTFMPLLPSTRYRICATLSLLGAMLDDEAKDAALLALLDEHIAGGLAEGGEVGHGAGIGGQHLELGALGQLGQRLLGLQDRQGTGQTFGIQRLVGHRGSPGSRWPSLYQ